MVRAVHGNGSARKRGSGRDPEKQARAKSEYGKRRTNQYRKETKAEKDLAKIRQLLEDNGVDPENIGSVKAVRLNEWEMAAKVGEKGNKRIEKTKLSAASIVIEPSWVTGPEWPLIEPGKPVSVRVPKRTGPTLMTKNWKTLVFLPDPQIGYRRLANGELESFHDEKALNLALQITEAERPELVIHAGDFLDLAPMSTKFRQEAGFVMTVQPALDRGVEFLACVRELTKEQRLISGNHDVRLQNYLMDNAQCAFSVRPGGTPPDTWPDLSIQHLLRLDEMNCTYIGSYPAGATYVNNNLVAVHGAAIGTRMRTAAQVIVENERVSAIHGHTHKKALASKTWQGRKEPNQNVAYSPGCLCRIDGAVPSTKAAVDAFGNSIVSFENWQQGLGVIRYEETGKERFVIEDVTILDGWAQHRGTDFYAD